MRLLNGLSVFATELVEGATSVTCMDPASSLGANITSRFELKETSSARTMPTYFLLATPA
ncbi:MAG: hypothetical protein Q8S55_12285 [Methylococcaceae bacterium]|nr:hypothetical protein [Methylococcaceae bacterium]